MKPTFFLVIIIISFLCVAGALADAILEGFNITTWFILAIPNIMCFGALIGHYFEKD